MLPFLCGSIRCGNNKCLTKQHALFGRVMTRQCNLPYRKNVFQNVQLRYVVYASPSCQMLCIPLPIYHRQWVTEPINCFPMVCCDTYLMWFVLVITKWPALCYLAIWPSINVMWTLTTFLSIISWYYQNYYPHTHDLWMLYCVNQTLVVCICMSSWCEWCTWH